VLPVPPFFLPIPTRRSAGQEGFTLVEILLVAIVLSTGLVGIASLSTIANRNQSNSLSEATRVNAIASDIAAIQRINDRYTCGSVTTTTGSCAISSSDLSQSGYFPSNANGQTNFKNRCAYTPSNFDLVTDLASNIPALPAALTSAGVTRSIATNVQAGIHRYTVTYAFGGNTVRTLTLVPTAAQWCP
jgi:type II secretory pathway pseudopilin PulG